MAIITYIQKYQQSGAWHLSTDEHGGNPPMMAAMDHAAWLGLAVFDGARTFEGVTPDLDLHCARLVASCKKVRLNPPFDAKYVADICRQGIAKFPKNSLLYIRPEFWAVDGIVLANPDKVNFAVVVHEIPFPSDRFSACISSYRRPDPRSAPTEAKAVSLYANLHLALYEAKDKGFDNVVMLDLNGNVCEFGTANMIYVKNNVVYTPEPNPCFLNGITRRRVCGLLSDAGYKIVERRTTLDDLYTADEVFSVGNLFKVRACVKIESVEYPIGPVSTLAKKLYWDFAHGRISANSPIVV